MCQDYYKNSWHISFFTALSFTFETSMPKQRHGGIVMVIAFL